MADMRRLVIVVLTLAMLGPPAQADAEPSYGSANYMLPLCKTWLKIAVDKDAKAFKNILPREPVQLTTAGMCAGVVIGISETLRTFKFACPPQGVTNEQLVRMVVSEIEKHPENRNEDFIVPASAAMMASWPCH
jgi:hypothetical protein